MDYLFQIDGMNLSQPKAIVKKVAGVTLLEAKLSSEIHIWPIDLADIGMQLYWLGEGFRSKKACLKDKFISFATIAPKEGDNVFVVDNKIIPLKDVAKLIIDRTFKIQGEEAPKHLTKCLERRAIELDRIDTTEDIVGRGSYDNPVVGIRGKRYSDFIKVDITKYPVKSRK